jgi:preprotein translocase subunit YajC
MGPLIILAATFLLMWLLFILPQQRRVRAHQALVARLAVGDEVMTTSGFYGTVVELDDADAQLQLGPGIVVRVARGAIARRLDDEVPAPAPPQPASTAADRAVEPPVGGDA